MRIWVTAGTLSLLASLSQAADLPQAVTPADFPPTDPELVLLGRDLFFDPILSGNKNIACATCHHPSLASADGMSLGLGEGAVALGPARRIDPENAPHSRIPRNAPALLTLGPMNFLCCSTMVACRPIPMRHLVSERRQTRRWNGLSHRCWLHRH